MNRPRERGATHWVIAFTAAFAVATTGGLLTDLGPWYFELRKPAWQPPGWLFGPVWTFIFACTAIAGVLGWRGIADSAARRRMLTAFGLNAALNVGWSLLFFHLHRPDWALMEVAALWASVVLLIAILWPQSRTAALLLAPYLIWVSFAAFLNFTIVQLNRPFDTV